MTTSRTQVVAGHGGKDPIRRVILVLLALYLSPAVLMVFLIGGLGLACCAVLRLAGDEARVDPATRRDGPARAVGVPHLREASRRRSPNR